MAEPKTFSLHIEDVGDFAFRRRTLRDEIRIGAAHERLTEGLEDASAGFRRTTYMIAALEVLTVSAPDGWDPMELDPLDADTFAKIGAVYGGLREAEERFRADKTGKPAIPGAGADQVG